MLLVNACMLDDTPNDIHASIKSLFKFDLAFNNSLLAYRNILSIYVSEAYHNHEIKDLNHQKSEDQYVIS
jgi:hypothetical protein